jgi:hypothetical protein
MQRIDNPIPLFLDLHGELLDAGYVYVGTANADPEVSPLAVYWDAALTIPAVQPLRTRGGCIVNNGAPSLVFTGDTDYSLRVRDANGNLVSYVPAASATGGVAYQPLDPDLTAIAAVATQPFGRSLLAAVTAAAAKALLGIVNSLALTGGTVTGNILRGGAGPHLYHKDGTFTSGKVFVTAVGAADPTANPGDIWLQYTP